MASAPSKHNRHSIRWKRYDYSEPGLYFVTICTHEKRLILGRISPGEALLLPAGEVAQKCWYEIPRRFPTVLLDALVIMPNHLHGVLILVRPLLSAEALKGREAHEGAASGAPTDLRPTLGKVIRAFKSTSAIEVNRLLGRAGKPVWQRNYYERVIRTPRELGQIQKYIEMNPIRWEYDRENPPRKEEPQEGRSKQRPYEPWYGV